MGINATINALDQFGVVRMLADKPILAGDLVSSIETGCAVPANPLFTLAQENNTVAGLPVLSAQTVLLTSGYGVGRYFGRTMAELGNGNIVLAYSGDGVTDTTNVSIKIRTIFGGDVVTTLVSTDLTVGQMRVVRLNQDKFIVVWSYTTGNTLRFAVLNNDGSIAVAAATVSALNTTGYGDIWNVNVLASGEAIIAYGKVATNDLCFKRYNASGVLQGSEVVVDAGASTNSICVQALDAGGFVIKYRRGATTAGHKFARYDATGVLQGAVTVLSASTIFAGVAGFDNDCLELAGGNLVFQVPSEADGLIDLYIYSSNGVLITSIDLGGLLVQSESCGICRTPGGGFAVSYRSSSGFVTVRTFSAAGVTLLSPVITSINAYAATGTAGAGAWMLSLGPVGFIIGVASQDSGSGQWQITMGRISSAGVLIGSVLVVSANGTKQIGALRGLLHSSSVLVCSHGFVSLGPSIGVYYPQRKSVFGVALESAAADALCRVGTKGTYVLNANRPYGGATDQRLATVPGVKGVIVTNTAVLAGVV